MIRTFLALALAVFAALPALAAGPSFKKVVVVVLENAAYDKAIAQPFLSSLTKRGALLSNFHAQTHPSQPNYIAMVAGTPAGVRDDKPVTLDIRHIGDLLEDAGKAWKVYAQGYPGGCFLGERSGPYVRKHVPFLSFKNVQTNPKRCANIVDDSAFPKDLSSGALPAFTLFVPNLKNDGHDTGVAAADQWLASYFGPLLDKLPPDVLVVITFDEDDWVHGNHIFTALVGAGVAPGASSAQTYDHYSLLRTIENALGTGSLGQNDDGAATISGIWK